MTLSLQGTGSMCHSDSTIWWAVIYCHPSCGSLSSALQLQLQSSLAGLHTIRAVEARWHLGSPELVPSILMTLKGLIWVHPLIMWRMQLVFVLGGNSYRIQFLVLPSIAEDLIWPVLSSQVDIHWQELKGAVLYLQCLKKGQSMTKITKTFLLQPSLRILKTCHISTLVWLWC
jgi:hypothetical protein